MTYKVVIIDDEGWTRDTIKRLGRWKELGFSIVGEAADGVSGIECINTLQPHVIITDMRMPGMDGVELLQVLQKNNIDVKIIVVSGFYDYSYTRQALNSRVVDYLLKPIDEEEFNKALEKCVQDLEMQTTNQKRTKVSIIGEVHHEWLSSYRIKRDTMRKSLESLSLQGVEMALEEIRLLLMTFREQTAMLKVLIRVNYDLQRITEEAFIAFELEESGVVYLDEMTLAIRENTTYEQLIMHYEKVCKMIVELGVAEKQRKNHLDITEIKQFIQDNFNQNITLTTIAKDHYVSKEYLSRLFKRETGTTFSEYLIQVRMERAKDLILVYGIPIQKVAEQVGYVEISHFYKTFKKYYRTSPAKLRENHIAQKLTNTEVNNVK